MEGGVRDEFGEYERRGVVVVVAVPACGSTQEPSGRTNAAGSAGNVSDARHADRRATRPVIGLGTLLSGAYSWRDEQNHGYEDEVLPEQTDDTDRAGEQPTRPTTTNACREKPPL
jgi:hypothetical protein